MAWLLALVSNIHTIYHDLRAYLLVLIGQLYDVLEEITKANKSEDSKAVRDSDYIALDNVDVTAPGGQLLIRNLSFAVEKGRSIVITGPR